MQKHKLSNGVTILADQDNRFSSVGFAISLHGGLRSESIETAGITHLTEHLVLKKTKSKSARQIAEYVDLLGGDVNAFTDADSMCLYGYVQKDDTKKIMDFFAELLFDPDFSQKDLAIEKEIVRQEILDSEDDPGEVNYNLFCKYFWPNSLLGLPVSGDIKNLETFSYGDIYERLQSLLQGDKITIVASGAVSLEEVVEYAEKNFSHLVKGKRAEFVTPDTSLGVYAIQEKFSQVHFSLGCSAPGMLSDRFDAAVVASAILGGGMSSRLFQALREDNGLVYDVGAALDFNKDTSALIISGACENRNLAQALELISGEISEFKAEKLDTDEVERNIQSIKSQMLIELDSVQSRMWRMLESEYVYGELISIKDQIAKYERLTLKDLEEEKLKILSNFLLVLTGDVEGYEPEVGLKQLCGL